MMKRFSLFMLLFAGVALLSAYAQQAAQTVDRPSEPNFVFDDDGGAVQIVPPDFSVAGEKKFHGGTVMASAQQVSIFLGAGWGDQQVRGRQAALIDVAVNNGAAPLAEMQKHKIKTLRAAPRLEDFGDLSKVRVNDLTIQQKLSDLLQSKAIPAPTSSTVYVIYLAPEINSTLGAHKAGVDYLAYHNFVNLEAGEVHYVVVPFHENAEHHSHAAARAFAEAALSPNGKGWY
jgi:hypothetical protein